MAFDCAHFNTHRFQTLERTEADQHWRCTLEMLLANVTFTGEDNENLRVRPYLFQKETPLANSCKSSELVPIQIHEKHINSSSSEDRTSAFDRFFSSPSNMDIFWQILTVSAPSPVR